jgi:hypothetical protein
MSAPLDQEPQPRAGALTIHRDHCETLDPRGLLTDGTVSALIAELALGPPSLRRELHRPAARPARRGGGGAVSSRGAQDGRSGLQRVFGGGSARWRDSQPRTGSASRPARWRRPVHLESGWCPDGRSCVAVDKGRRRWRVVPGVPRPRGSACVLVIQRPAARSKIGAVEDLSSGYPVAPDPDPLSPRVVRKVSHPQFNRRPSKQGPKPLRVPTTRPY